MSVHSPRKCLLWNVTLKCALTHECLREVHWTQVQDQNSRAQQSQNLLLEICKLLIQNSPISRDEKIAFKFTYQLYQLVFYDLYFVSTDTHYLFYKKCSEEVKDAFREKRQDIEINELYT